jgi:hypothetical protein
MKTNISILTWINRIMMIPFIISLLILIIDYDYIFYAVYIAFAVGCFHLLSLANRFFYYKKINNLKIKFIYLILVIAFFISAYLLIEFEQNISNKNIIIYILWITPVFLSLFWTYILEVLNKKL